MSDGGREGGREGAREGARKGAGRLVDIGAVYTPGRDCVARTIAILTGLNAREDVAMTTKGVLRPLKHGLKYLFTIKTLKSVVTFHFHQLIETRSATDRENILVRGIVRHFTLQNSDIGSLTLKSCQLPDYDCRSDEASIAATACMALIFFRRTP